MKKTSPTHDVLCLQQCCKKQALARNKSKAVAPNICKMGLKISLWPLIYSSAPASGSHKLLLGQMPYQLRWQSCWPCRVLPLSLLEGTAAPVEAPHTHTHRAHWCTIMFASSLFTACHAFHFRSNLWNCLVPCLPRASHSGNTGTFCPDLSTALGLNWKACEAFFQSCKCYKLLR